MLPGLYSAAAGMLSRLDQQDVIANNLANVNTAGFKRTAAGFSSFSAQLRGAEAGIPQCAIPFMTAYQDERQGVIQDTGVPTNLALDGPGFFVVQTETGEQFVRGGNFRLDSAGHLVNGDGFPVLGQRGPIQVSGTDWSVDSEGNVHSAGAVVDKLRIETGAASGASGPTRVAAGSLEASNVNVIEEMVSMITAMRAYETCQRVIQAFDQTLDKAINQMGRIA